MLWSTDGSGADGRRETAIAFLYPITWYNIVLAVTARTCRFVDITRKLLLAVLYRLDQT